MNTLSQNRALSKRASFLVHGIVSFPSLAHGQLALKPAEWDFKIELDLFWLPRCSVAQLVQILRNSRLAISVSALERRVFTAYGSGLGDHVRYHCLDKPGKQGRRHEKQINLLGIEADKIEIRKEASFNEMTEDFQRTGKSKAGRRNSPKMKPNLQKQWIKY